MREEEAQDASFATKKHILVCTNLVAKWVEAKYASFSTKRVVVEFIFTQTFTIFGVPREIFSNNGSQFISNLV